VVPLEHEPQLHGEPGGEHLTELPLGVRGKMLQRARRHDVRGRSEPA
jgi:hypothetical protein